MKLLLLCHNIIILKVEKKSRSHSSVSFTALLKNEVESTLLQIVSHNSVSISGKIALRSLALILADVAIVTSLCSLQVY